MTHEFFGEALFSYSRAQAIADGVLVDLSQFPEISQMWMHQMACTDTVWNLVEAATDDEGKDLPGVLRDISHMAMVSARVKGASADRIQFRVIIGTKTHELKLIVGPGDTPQPVLTLMLATES